MNTKQNNTHTRSVVVAENQPPQSPVFSPYFFVAPVFARHYPPKARCQQIRLQPGLSANDVVICRVVNIIQFICGHLYVTHLIYLLLLLYIILT